MDELDELTAEARQRRANARASKTETAAQTQAVLDEMDGAKSGRTPEQVAQDRADADERQRLQRLGVRFG